MITMREKAGGVSLLVRIQPGAARNAIVGEHHQSLKVRIAAAPVRGAANQECRRFLAAYFGVKPAQVQIEAGATSHNKWVFIGGISKADVEQRLSSLPD